MKNIVKNVLKEFGEFKFSSVETVNANNIKTALNLILIVFTYPLLWLLS